MIITPANRSNFGVCTLMSIRCIMSYIDYIKVFVASRLLKQLQIHSSTPKVHIEAQESYNDTAPRSLDSEVYGGTVNIIESWFPARISINVLLRYVSLVKGGAKYLQCKCEPSITMESNSIKFNKTIDNYEILWMYIFVVPVRTLGTIWHQDILGAQVSSTDLSPWSPWSHQNLAGSYWCISCQRLILQKLIVIDLPLAQALPKPCPFNMIEYGWESRKTWRVVPHFLGNNVSLRARIPLHIFCPLFLTCLLASIIFFSLLYPYFSCMICIYIC